MYRVLVAQSGVMPETAVIREFLAAGSEVSCCFAQWSELAAGGVDPSSFELVIAIADASETQERILGWVASHRADVSVLAALPSAASEEWLRMASQAADDFIICPFTAAELQHRIGRLLRQPQQVLEGVRRQLLEELGLTNLIGSDPVFLRAIGHLPRFARSDAPVCITGETGTGKELCARALHYLSRRQCFPFIGVDCGALPEQLFENEMFGHARGAFTDAHRDHRGLVAMAQEGTLFLDEIDALSLASQAKLLRFLQDRTFRPLGSERFEEANVRVVVATNRDLESAVHSRHFRSDLFFRLNVLRLRLPPLRERRGDVELLACAAFNEYVGASNGASPGFSPMAMKALTSHLWPGNVRELYNVIQRAVVAAEGGRILPEHLDLPPTACTSQSESCIDFRGQRAAAVANFERHYVEDLLRKHNGNVTHAAREAQQDRRAFGRFIKKYNINRTALSM